MLKLYRITAENRVPTLLLSVIWAHCSPRIASAQAGVLHLEHAYRTVCSLLEVVRGSRARKSMQGGGVGGAKSVRVLQREGGVAKGCAHSRIVKHSEERFCRIRLGSGGRSRVGSLAVLVVYHRLQLFGDPKPPHQAVSQL